MTTGRKRIGGGGGRLRTAGLSQRSPGRSGKEGRAVKRLKEIMAENAPNLTRDINPQTNEDEQTTNR